MLINFSTPTLSTSFTHNHRNIYLLLTLLMARMKYNKPYLHKQEKDFRLSYDLVRPFFLNFSVR